MRAVLLFAVLAGCSAASTPPAPIAKAPVATAPADEPPPLSPWAHASRSPWPGAGADPRVAALAAGCLGTDRALERIAEALAQDDAPADPDELAPLLRLQGEPHVRPRVVTAIAKTHDDDALRARFAKEAGPQGRCGVAIAQRPEGEKVIAVIVDALADLDPLPIRARTGEWLTFAANLHVPATNAKLVILGPQGAPRTVPTSLVGSKRAVARFALDRPGPFTVQLIADLGAGPRPLLEARVFADIEPFEPELHESESVPTDPTAAVEAFVRETRRREALPALKRDRRLDELALAHAEAMRQAKSIQHDLGDGDLAQRFETAGLAAKVVGENVARGRSVARAQRALDASPSHRANLVRADYTHLGVAAVTDGTHVYVCQVFASGLR